MSGGRERRQKLDFHPHLHCIVTGGALSPNGKRWRSPKQLKFLFPVRALAALFRGKFLAGLRQMLDAGELHLPDSEPKIPVNRARWFSLLYTRRWVLYAKRPFGGPQQVLSYLANYTHRVALSNRRNCRRRCAAPDRHRHLSRLPARFTAQAVNPLRPGVHPALQLAYPTSGFGAYPPLWNSGQ